MRKHLLAAGIAAAALIPTFAAAQSCDEQRQHQSNGTVTGAVVGGVAGAAVAGRDDRVAGALIGGTLGAIIGNQSTKPSNNCRYAYGYYDQDGRWHATGVARADARGYYDRDGNWIEGPPNGYYDRDGRWVAGSDVAAAGYYDSYGRWVPASAGGYYDNDGRYVGGVAAGYYDGSGRWIAGPATGHYDARGRWVSGSAAGHYEGNVWVADAAPGYYDVNGRWHAGTVVGYYDARGRWVTTAQSAGGYGSDVVYTTPDRGYDRWSGAGRDIGSREAFLDSRIRSDFNSGRITRMEANNALSTLADIKREDRRRARRHGGLNSADQIYLQGRLDALADQLREDRRD